MKNKFSIFYIKYILKSPFLFYVFLLVGVGIFLYLTQSTIITTENGEITLLKLIIMEAGKG
jgi:predicted ABC-type exoprotein transport system permease subunit